MTRRSRRGWRSGDVGAGDEQNERNGAEQHDHRPANVGDYVFAQRCNGRAASGVRLRVLLREPTHHVGGAGSGGLDRDAVAKPGDHVQPAVEALCPRLGAAVDWEPEIRVTGGREVEAARKNSANDMRNAIDRHGAADNGGVGSKVASPEAVGDDDRIRPAGDVIFGGERTSTCRTDAEHVE